MKQKGINPIEKTNSMKTQNTTNYKSGIGTINCIHLTKKIIDMIDFASHQLMIGNIARGNFYLNVVKCLIQDNKNTNIWVSNEFIDKAEKDYVNSMNEAQLEDRKLGNI